MPYPTAYVTQAEFQELTGDTSTVTPLQIETASRAVNLALRSAVYAIDPVTGLPTDATVLRDIKLATATQLQAMLAADKAKAAASSNPLGRPLASASIDGVSWNASEGLLDHFTLPADGSLCPAALAFLSNIYRTVWVLP